MADSLISPPIGQVPHSGGFTAEPLAPAVTPGPAPVPGASAPSVPPSAVQPSPAPVSPPPPAAMPTRSRFSGTLLKWLVVIAVGLFIVSIASLFWSSPSFSDKDVVLTLEGPDRVTSGAEVAYTLTLTNNTKLPLKDMSFRLFYPEGSVVLKDGQPTQPQSEGFTIDQLQPGQTEKREFTMFIVGDKGSIKTASVNLIFKAGSIRSAFEKEVKVTTAVTALPVTVTLTAPPSSVSGQPVTYIVDIRNESGGDLEDLRLELKYPDGFTVRELDPDPEGSTTSTWAVATLKDGQGRRYTVQGTLAGVEREAKTVTAILKRHVGDQYIDYVRADSVTLLSSPLLSVRTTVNGSRDYVGFPDDKLEYAIRYTNNSRHNLIGLELSVRLEGQMYELSGVDVTDGFFDQAAGTVRFSSSGVPDFASLAPGKSGTVKFEVPLKSSFVSGGGTQAFFVKASVRLSTPNVPTGVDGDEVFSQDVLTTKIGSQPTLTEVLMTAGGAIPPAVGQESVYLVSWSLTNPGNELRNANVAVTLSPGVTFKGEATAGNGPVPSFDVNTGRVTWQVGTVPFGTGTAGTAKYTATFNIAVTPSVNQQGNDVILLGQAALSGTDSFTGQAVQSTVREAGTKDVQDIGDDSRVQ